MRVKILSDLHNNRWHKFNYIPLDEDVCILAGDIGEGTEGVYWARNNIPENIRVFYVPGNHEYYGFDIDSLNDKFRAFNREDSHVKVLLNETDTAYGIRFIGSTMWTNFNLYGTEALSGIHWRQGLNDARCITKHGRALNIQDMINMHQDSIKFLESVEGDVLITHYCPEKSVATRYINDPYTPGFASRIPKHITGKFVLHVHGHTHSSFDYGVFPRVICNPQGYITENSGDFDPDLIVDIEREEDGTIHLS